MTNIIELHKQGIEWWKNKLGLTDYTLLWIAFIQGFVIGMLIYHFFIK